MMVDISRDAIGKEYYKVYQDEDDFIPQLQMQEDHVKVKQKQTKKSFNNEYKKALSKQKAQKEEKQTSEISYKRKRIMSAKQKPKEQRKQRPQNSPQKGRKLKIVVNESEDQVISQIQKENPLSPSSPLNIEETTSVVVNQEMIEVQNKEQEEPVEFQPSETVGMNHPAEQTMKTVKSEFEPSPDKHVQSNEEDMTEFINSHREKISQRKSDLLDHESSTDSLNQRVTMNMLQTKDLYGNVQKKEESGEDLQYTETIKPDQDGAQRLQISHNEEEQSENYDNEFSPRENEDYGNDFEDQSNNQESRSPQQQSLKKSTSRSKKSKKKNRKQKKKKKFKEDFSDYEDDGDDFEQLYNANEDDKQQYEQENVQNQQEYKEKNQENQENLENREEEEQQGYEGKEEYNEEYQDEQDREMQEYFQVIDQLSKAEYQQVKNNIVKARLNTLEKKKLGIEIPEGFHQIQMFSSDPHSVQVMNENREVEGPIKIKLSLQFAPKMEKSLAQYAIFVLLDSAPFIAINIKTIYGEEQ